MTDAEFVWARRDSLPSPDKLELLAEWLDWLDSLVEDKPQSASEIQKDLRRWSAYIRSLGGTSEPESE